MKLRKIKKKGGVEFSMVTLFVVLVGIIIIAPIMLMVVNKFVTPFGNTVGNMTEQAGTNVAHVAGVFITFWDWVLVIFFLINVIMLFITAFLVNTHPLFLLLYIFFGLLLFIFAPTLLDVLDKMYGSADLALEVSQLTFVDFIREYLAVILLGLYVVTGIIVYARFKAIT